VPAVLAKIELELATIELEFARLGTTRPRLGSGTVAARSARSCVAVGLDLAKWARVEIVSCLLD